mgnify:CR=1 FL=1
MPRRRPKKKERTCGECRACCIVLGFEAAPDEADFRKPEGTPCPHLIPLGCRIYDTRPPVCRRFQCGWLSAPNLPESLRPDRCGVLFCTNDHPSGHGYAVFAYEMRPGALEADLPQWLIHQVVRELPVFLVRPGKPVEVLVSPDRVP